MGRVRRVRRDGSGSRPFDRRPDGGMCQRVCCPDPGVWPVPFPPIPDGRSGPPLVRGDSDLFRNRSPFQSLGLSLDSCLGRGSRSTTHDRDCHSRVPFPYWEDVEKILLLRLALIFVICKGQAGQGQSEIIQLSDDCSNQ